MTNISMRPRAETVTIRNVHSLYRVYKIPGLRKSPTYEGTGIVKTYMMDKTEKDYPDDENAVPVLTETGTGCEIMDKEVVVKPLVCPECNLEGRQDRGGLPICPECGLVLRKSDTGDSTDEQIAAVAEDQAPIDRTVNSAERYSAPT
jgi:hypothetical protein